MIRVYDESEELFEMANIQPRTTGLSMQLYATFDGEHEVQHGPRVKVKTKNAGRFPVLLPDVEPLNENGEYNKLEREDKKLVDEAVPFIRKYKDSFMSHWNAKIGDEQLRKVLSGVMTLEEAEKDAKENGVE